MNELEEEQEKLATSQVFQDVLDISRRLTFDTKNEDRLIQAFAGLLIDTLKAIDNESITFKDKDTEENLHGLLAILLKRVTHDQETMH